MTLLILKYIFWFIRWPMMAWLWFLVGFNIVRFNQTQRFDARFRKLYLWLLFLSFVWTLLVTNVGVDL